MASFSGIHHGGYGDFETSGTLNGGGICFEWANTFTELGIGAFTSHYTYYGDYGSGIVISYDNDYNSSPVSELNKNQIKDRITALKSVLNLTDNTEIELKSVIDNLDLHYIDVNRALRGFYFPEDNATMSGIGTCYNCPIGTMLNNNWNVNGSNVGDFTINGKTFTGYASVPFASIFNVISYAIENNIIEVSDELKNIVDDQFVGISDDTSFFWDVYINSYKSNPLIGGYKTESILVRWSCPAVNKATTEYLAENPDYPYRADNTLIRLSTKKQGAGGFSDNFYTGRYGDLETKIPIQKLTETAGVSYFMQTVSAFIPSLDVGDVTLYLRQTFEDLSLTDTCTVQIPVNKAFANVDNLKTTNGKYGSVVRLHWGDPESGVPDYVVGWNDEAHDHFEDDVQKYDDDTSDVESDISFNSNISLLTATYAMNESNLKALGKKLWDNTFLENISMINNSPIENILSVKSFPFPINGGTSKNVILGNVDMEVTGNELPSSYIPIKTIGKFTVPKKFSGHLEWLNWHTVVTCYLPYIGFVELETKQILDKTVTLKYIYDMITGVCTACFYANNIEIAKYSGTLAIDIPITASNRAQVEAGYIRSALGALGSLSSGNLFGVAANGFGALTAHNSFTTKGSPSPSCDGFDEQKSFIIIDYPVYQEPTNFGHEYGYPCNLSLTLGNLSGFTQLQNVDVTGLAITENEREELKRLLEGGVYL